jgi:hypothetical protein
MVSGRKAPVRRNADRGGGMRLGPAVGSNGSSAVRVPRRVVMPGATQVLAGILAGVLLAATLAVARQGPINLKPPGLRLIKDPSVVIPAPYFYANRPLSLPAYRDAAGEPADGWSRKFIATRRFNSNQSAWIYYRRQDLQKSVVLDDGGQGKGLCIWPGGSLIVIESYAGGGPNGQPQASVEIDLLAKADRNTASYGKAFLAAEWSYARFTSRGVRAIGGAKARECHQCHGIAFQLTGDLVFTRFP